ncbi:MAG: glycine zipper domain-containing protein [Brevundimonas sp.]|uniref:YMGG-like glycine zipper-containing protein n=1 Tax=Brevundimonas sp. TaxID=1871086 RepID=UPI00273240FC|nr:glycine zipper domain-containing protein [Brevundimonas sp.]MBX9617114.1 glycine zipper 2TM domain-containing protein [Caulobacteraceae bacterium]MDP3404585.1 glycine zipper domain-containing protein [Brevundimonas sp.]
MNKAIIAIGAAGLLASACASDPYGYGGNTGSGPNQTVRQGAIGAGIGAVAGAIIGNNVGSGNAATGAAIGAVVGGAAGAIRGSQQDRNNQQRYRDARGNYYYCYDNRQDECYWENGQRRY